MNVVAIGITVIIITPIVFVLLGYVIALGERMKEAEEKLNRTNEVLRSYEEINDRKMELLMQIILDHTKHKGEEE